MFEPLYKGAIVFSTCYPSTHRVNIINPNRETCTNRTSDAPLKPKRNYKRGYPVAFLIGLEENRAALWKVYSNIVKHEKTIQLDGTRNDPKALYNFHESIINTLRPTLKEGVRSIILASPAKSNYARSFINHIQSHHAWLTQGPNKAALSEITGSADTLPNVTALTKNPAFHQIISETTTEETETLMGILEKRLNAPNQDLLVLYALKEIEDSIFSPWKPSKPKPEYLMLTDVYLASSREKNRLHRLMQIAANRNVKTRIVNAESPAGIRLAQLGGIALLLTTRA
jgi:stalled ribosome rescue protein Dom34